jgi:hypothetical protein
MLRKESMTQWKKRKNKQNRKPDNFFQNQPRKLPAPAGTFALLQK